MLILTKMWNLFRKTAEAETIKYKLQLWLNEDILNILCIHQERSYSTRHAPVTAEQWKQSKTDLDEGIGPPAVAPENLVSPPQHLQSPFMSAPIKRLKNKPKVSDFFYKCAS